MQGEPKNTGLKWWKGLLLLGAAAVMFASCEDDPLVIPDTSEEEECTGSYCKLEKNEDDFLSLPLAFLNLKNNPETF